MSTHSNTENTAAGGDEVPYIPVGLPVKNEQDAINVLKRAMSYVKKMTEQLTSFKEEKIFSGVQVSSSAVVGHTPRFAKRGIKILYALLPVRESAENIYGFLTTSQGYQLIDPNSDPKDFGRPVEGYGPWELMSGDYSIPKFQVEYADMRQEAIIVLKRAMSDVDKMMEQQTSFKNAKIFSGVQVSSSAVVGHTSLFATRGIRIVYAPIPVRETAEKFYRFLISKEGYKLIDPNSDPKDFGRPVEGYGPWELMSGDYSIPKFQVEYADMRQEAVIVLKRAMSDVDKMMEQQTSFKNEKIFLGVQVSSSAVVGPTPLFAKRGIRIAYASIPVRETAENFYRFLISKEGYQLIDPNSDSKDFGVPVKGYGPWKLTSGGHCQVEYAYMPLMPAWMPITLLKPRDYVVLNGFDNSSKTFYSMSVQAATDEKSGSSIYEAEGVAKDGPKGRVRMAFFSAMRVEQDQKNSDRSILHYFQVSSCFCSWQIGIH
jgi:hypothetical protein